MSDTKGIRVSLRIPEDVYKAVEEIAERTYRPLSAVVLESLILYIDHERRVTDVQMALHDFLISPEGKEFAIRFLQENFDEFFAERLDERISTTLVALAQSWKVPPKEKG
jgi:predicted DNA-binding protein